MKGARIRNRVGEVRRKWERRIPHGIDKTMSDAVIYAKSNHPGWKNVTATAEGSVRVGEFAHRDGRGFVGRWGSVGGTVTIASGPDAGIVTDNYVIWLELKHGSFLRGAAEVTYPSLARNIRRAPA